MLSVIEMFSGIGAFRKALERQAVEHEVIGISEIDKYAIQSYNAMFGETKNYGDISKVLKFDYADMWTYGFPCQDISVAGKQAGIKRDTRSGLLYQVQRLLETAYQYNELPKYLIMENVKNLVGKKFRKDFDSWLDYLDEIGYNNYWQVLNAKDYGIPQNRERVFCISIRKDIDNGEFKFPEKQELKLRLKDMLEDEVDENYYLKDIQIENIQNSNFAQEAKRIQEKEYCDTLLARDYKDPKCVQVGTLDIKGMDCIKRVYSDEGLSPTLTDMQGGNRQPKIIENISEFPCIGASRGRNPNNQSDRTPGITTEQRLEINTKGTSNAITTVQKDNYVIENNDYRIRKLTPKECWRLMGFDDESFEKAAQVNSNTQLYKQAGNSIVVNVLEEIIKNLGLPTHF